MGALLSGRHVLGMTTTKIKKDENDDEDICVDEVDKQPVVMYEC